MIYDSLDQLSRYTGLSRSLDAAVKAITSADLFALPVGSMNWFRIWFTPLSARLRQSLWRRRF